MQFVSFLKSLQLFLLLKNNTSDNRVFIELTKLEGIEISKRMYDFILGDKILTSHPIWYHPGQAKYVFINCPELRDIIAREADSIGFDIVNTSIKPMESVINTDLIVSIIKTQSPLEDDTMPF